MHEVVRRFAKKHSSLFHGRVLDVGSFNVNGQLRDTLGVSIGVDMRPGPGVDMVVNASDLVKEFGTESFDGVVSGDTLEHCEDWAATMENMWGVLKPSGALLVTLANPNKPYHGYPADFHRWPLDRFVKLFGKNHIYGQFDENPSMGVVARKDGPLDLSHAPDPVRRR